MTDCSFAAVVNTELTEPLKTLCQLLASEGSAEEFAFFANLLFMLGDPEDEAQVLAAVIELSNCAFVGLNFSSAAQSQINDILDRAISLAHTMSAPAHRN